jgi:2-dehydro-3-deoxyphosphooctonate aldolase (KDO 8-P synthase)
MKSRTPFFLISGPCVIEDEDVTLRIATRLKELTDRMGIPFTFKASYDKANRTAIASYRGPGIQDGLKVLAKVKQSLGVPILSDVHRR